MTIAPANPTEVLNQPPPLEDYDLFAADLALREGVAREGAGWADDRLSALGTLAGTPEAIAWGFQANRHLPELHTHDRFGHRIDEVEYHPAWHEVLGVAVREGMHGAPWTDEREGAHVTRAAAFMLWSQAESGHGCPISMTYAAIPALRVQSELAAVWEPLITSHVYDPVLRPADQKEGALFGMAMTERQGGSDVRANTSIAMPVDGGGPAGEYRITGHKWFCSAPMCDAFLVLAQAPGGLSCFLVPRVLPDGERNVFRIDRLKDKLGNRSNASSEITFDDTAGWLVGEEGRGVPTIIKMVNSTRLDCIIGTSALMRQATAQAIHHATYRHAFGKVLVDQPLMRNVLADLAIESEAATTMMLRLAATADRAVDEREVHLRRLGTAVGKYWVTKRGPMHTAEALECLGGNGYVEESIMGRLYREAPVNSTWEGSGNVNALDLLRALAKQPAALDAFCDEVETARGADARLDAHVARMRDELGTLDDLEWRARRLVEGMALALQGSLLVRYAPPAVADAFCASRLTGDQGLAFGTLPSGVDAAAIIERAAPVARV